MLESHLSQLKLTNDRHRRRTEHMLRSIFTEAMILHNIRHVVVLGKGDLGAEILLEWDDELDHVLPKFSGWVDTELALGRSLYWTDPNLVEMRNQTAGITEVLTQELVITNTQNVYGPNCLLWFEQIDGELSLTQIPTENK